MTIRKKKTCNGCKALAINIDTLKTQCYLNFQMETTDEGSRPLDICPKPRTQKAFKEEFYKRVEQWR